MKEVSIQFEHLTRVVVVISVKVDKFLSYNLMKTLKRRTNKVEITLWAASEFIIQIRTIRVLTFSRGVLRCMRADVFHFNKNFKRIILLGLRSLLRVLLIILR